jgi:ankyrin repeat protein
MHSICEKFLLKAVDSGIHDALDEAISAVENATAPSSDRLDRALIFAVQRNALPAAKLLLRRGASVEAREPTLWRTPLIVAAHDGSLTMTEFLLENGADVGAEDDFGNSALNAAAEKGCAALMDLLVAHGAEVDHRNDLAWTPLISACASGNLAAVNMLTDHGASLEARSVLGWTPLIVAAQNDHAGVVARLLELGARVDVTDSFGRTALAVADSNRTVADIFSRQALSCVDETTNQEV